MLVWDQDTEWLWPLGLYRLFRSSFASAGHRKGDYAPASCIACLIRVVSAGAGWSMMLSAEAVQVRMQALMCSSGAVMFRCLPCLATGLLTSARHLPTQTPCAGASGCSQDGSRGGLLCPASHAAGPAARALPLGHQVPGTESLHLQCLGRLSMLILLLHVLATSQSRPAAFLRLGGLGPEAARS